MWNGRRLHLYRDRKKEWRWRVIGRTGRKLATSGEGYKRLGACTAMALSLFPSFRHPDSVKS